VEDTSRAAADTDPVEVVRIAMDRAVSIVLVAAGIGLVAVGIGLVAAGTGLVEVKRTATIVEVVSITTAVEGLGLVGAVRTAQADRITS
jgi:hypothetical protein